MRWKTGRRSSNVEDRRNQRSPSPMRMRAGGGGLLTLAMRFLPMLLKTKIGRTILIIGVVGFFGAKTLGIDLMPLLLGTGGTQVATSNQPISAEEQELADFVSVVLADTETTWHQIFQKMGRRYKEPKLVMYSGSVSSACGLGQAAMGPFYCPGDQKMYIDLSFYRDLKTRYKAPGDFAQAYVIGHEVGHHVQTLLGISSKVHSAKRNLSKTEANKLSVKQELQADCFSGLWAHSADTQRQLLEQGDIQEALAAAAATGDDRLQKQARGYVVPDTFTHGTSRQRQEWFQRGYESGNIAVCDTFNS